MSVFNRTKRSDFLELIQLCRPFFKSNFDVNLLVNSAESLIAEHSGKTFNPNSNAVKLLEAYWYETLNIRPDFSVYDEPYYLGDIWACWCLYSRKYLLSLKNPKSMNSQSVIDYFGDLKTVVDLGCGFGFTTLGLKEIFNKSRVIGTNLESSYQFQVAQFNTQGSGVEIKSDFYSLGNVDLIFASEYFEHFERPLEHLREVISSCKPKYMIIANGFNGRAIGHFKIYKDHAEEYEPKKMSLKFGKTLRDLGYKKMKTNIWNNRPAIWSI